MMRIQVNRIKVAVQITFLLILVAAAQGILSLRFGTFRFLDLPLIFSVFYGFTLSNPVASVAIGSWVGLMQDSLSGGAFGANGFSKTLFGFIAASAGGKFNVEQPLTRCFALFLFSLGDGLLTTMLGLVAESPLRLSSDMAMTWVVSGMFNVLVGLFLFWYHDRTNNGAS